MNADENPTARKDAKEWAGRVDKARLRWVKTAQGLVDGTLEEKIATKLAYVLQVAMSNVDKVSFEPEEVEVEEIG